MSEEINEEAQVDFIEGVSEQNPFTDNNESVSPVINEDDNDSLFGGETDLDCHSDETETGFSEEEHAANDSETYEDETTSELATGVRAIVHEAADQQQQEVDSVKLDDIVGSTKAAAIGKEPSFAGFNCTVGCAGNCAGSCSGTCHNSCYNSCKSTYSN